MKRMLFFWFPLQDSGGASSQSGLQIFPHTDRLACLSIYHPCLNYIHTALQGWRIARAGSEFPTYPVAHTVSHTIPTWTVEEHLFKHFG